MQIDCVSDDTIKEVAALEQWIVEKTIQQT
jgi:hypothetical protein